MHGLPVLGSALVVAGACILLGCSSRSPWGTTVGAECTEIMTAYCARLSTDCSTVGIEAGVAQDGGSSSCLARNVAACSIDAGNATAITSTDDIASCTADVDNASCTLLQAGLPISCAGVVKLPE
jgi:hypothetical protein